MGQMKAELQSKFDPAGRTDSKGRPIVKRTPEEIQERQAPARQHIDAATAQWSRVQGSMHPNAPRPGGLREFAGNPELLKQSLEDSIKVRAERVSMLRKSGVKDASRRSAGTARATVSFAEGMTMPTGTAFDPGLNPNVRARAEAARRKK